MADAAFHPAQLAETSGWLKTLGKELQEPAFQEWSRAFFASHCDVFEEAEENKLAYTQVHERYQEEAEARLEAAGHAAGVPVDTLLERLPAYLAHAKGEDKPEQAAAECIDTLTSLSDFEVFKAAMLVAKRDAAGGASGAGMESTVFVDVVKGTDTLGSVLSLARTADDQDAGWTPLVRKPWFSIDKKTSGGVDGAGVMRATMAIDLPLEHALRMFLHYGPDRAAWDEHFRSASELCTFETSGPRVCTDQALRVRYAVPYLLRAFGIPSEQDVRLIWVKDSPGEGVHTFGILPWARPDAEASVSGAHAAIGTFRADPADPTRRTLYTGIREPGALEALPDWLVGWLASTFKPRMLTSMFDKYKRHLAAKAVHEGLAVGAAAVGGVNVEVVAAGV